MATDKENSVAAEAAVAAATATATGKPRTPSRLRAPTSRIAMTRTAAAAASAGTGAPSCAATVGAEETPRQPLTPRKRTSPTQISKVAPAAKRQETAKAAASTAAANAATSRTTTTRRAISAAPTRVTRAAAAAAPAQVVAPVAPAAPAVAPAAVAAHEADSKVDAPFEQLGLHVHAIMDTSTSYADLMSLKLKAEKGRTLTDKDRVAQMKPHCDALRAALQELLDKREELYRKCNAIEVYLQMKHTTSDSELNRAKAENQELQAKIADLQQQFVKLQTMYDMQIQAKEELRAEIPQLAQQKRRLSTELETMRASQKDIQSSLVAAQSELAHAQEQLAAKAAECEARQAKLEELSNTWRSQQDQMRQEHATAVSALREELQQTNSVKGREVETLSSKLEAATERVSSLQEQLSTVTAEHKKLVDERQSLVFERQRLEIANEHLTNELTSTKAELREHTAKASSLQQTLSVTMQQMVAANDSRQDQMNKERMELQMRIATLQAESGVMIRTESELRGTLKERGFEIEKLNAEIATKTASIASLEEKLSAALTELAAQKAEAASLRENLESMTTKAAEAHESLTHATSRIAHLTSETTHLTESNSKLSNESTVLKTQLKDAQDQIASLASDLKTVKLNCGVSQETQLAQLCEISKEATALRRQVEDMRTLQREMEELRSRNATLADQVFKSEMLRRQLHNRIQELRGNIRVFARVRPLAANSGDSKDSETRVVRSGPDSTSLTLDPRVQGGKPYVFKFDTVFGEDTSQAQVFDEVSQLVQSALDGYDVCLFSYGQTGTGKTYTMQGGRGEARGLIPRSVAHILNVAKESRAQGWSYELHASFLEIYNEKLRDLLVEQGSDAACVSIVHNEEGDPTARNLSRVPVTTAGEIEELLTRAAAARAVAATNMNEVSSRSHTVFTLRIKGVNQSQGAAVTGELNLVDLAGSERVSRSGAEGDRLKETQAINKSLSCLSDVFMALSKKTSHVPFRNSKLTFLLSKCFQGDGKTLMIVNLSPSEESLGETLCSCRFASTVSQVTIGKPTKRVSALVDNAAGGAAPDEGEDDAEDDSAPPSAAPTPTPVATATPTPAATGSSSATLSRLRAPTAASAAAANATMTRAKKPRTAWN